MKMAGWSVSTTIDRMVWGSDGEAVWYEEIEVAHEICWVGVKYH